jgi:hypothetical protein
MRGLDPRIHVFASDAKEDVEARNKPALGRDPSVRP